MGISTFFFSFQYDLYVDLFYHAAFTFEANRSLALSQIYFLCLRFIKNSENQTNSHNLNFRWLFIRVNGTFSWLISGYKKILCMVPKDLMMTLDLFRSFKF